MQAQDKSKRTVRLILTNLQNNADKETQTLEESLAEHHAWQMVWASEQKQGNANEKGTALR